MKSSALFRLAFACILPGVLHADPTFQLDTGTTTSVIGTTGGGTDDFHEDTLVPFDHSVHSEDMDEFSSAEASGRLQVTLEGLHLAGNAAGSAESGGSYPVGASLVAYGSSFAVRISLSEDDEIHHFTFTGGTSGTSGGLSYAEMTLYDGGSPETPLFIWGTTPGSSALGGTFSGVLEPGKSYLFTASDHAESDGNDLPAGTSAYQFDMQIVSASDLAYAAKREMCLKLEAALKKAKAAFKKSKTKRNKAKVKAATAALKKCNAELAALL